MTSMLSWARARLARWYLGRLQRTGFDLSKASLLPSAALIPLRRDGLDPVAELNRMREAQPVTRLPLPIGVGVWLVTGYEQARDVLADTATFSNDFANLDGLGIDAGYNPGGLGFADPPDHTRLRKLLTPEFTMRRLSRLGPRIDRIVAERLDRMATLGAAGAPVDMVAEFALPIPSLAICELLGVPYEERSDFQRLSTARFDLFGGAGASLGALSESLRYLREVVARQRANPGDGLLGMLITEHGDQVDDEELAGLADGLLTGGLETTASMLALGTIALLRDPDLAAAVREESRAAAVVEELLRYLTVVQVAFPRFARTDTRIADAQVKAGDVVLCSLSGANRDQHLGPDPARLDPAKASPAHLAFGHGAHRCIGAELAKMELRTAYPALLRRFPDLHLATDELRYRPASIVYGVEELPVLLTH